MKPIGESHEIMAAYAEIDLCHTAIKKLMNEEYTSTTKADTIVLFETIIKNKKIIDADYSNDERALQGLREL